MSPTASHGILLVDKSPGWTSHDVVGRCRRLLHTKKIGHAGTLDPMATGLLVLGVGQGTRLLTYLVGLDKTYRATIRLGRATTTDDAEGEPIGQVAETTGLDDSAIEAVLSGLRGEVLQVPSSVSAIKVDGRRAYARVRAGEDVELAARPVTIGRLEVTARREEAPFCDLDVIVDCSSGTYIRAIARDLGARLGVGGHLTALRRTRVGPFDVDEGVVVPPRESGDDADLPLRGLGRAAGDVLPSVRVEETVAAALGHGQRPRVDTAGAAGATDGPVAMLDEAGRLIAIARAEQDGRVAPQLVVPLDARS